MVAYRRNFIPGASYFFTITLRDRSSSLLVDRIDNLREVIRSVKKERPFRIDAMVILPDHLHAVWTLPPDDADYSIRWREIKSRFSRKIPVDEYRSAGRINKAERGIWQRRFWEHTLWDLGDMEKHIDYIHYNPVKHGYVSRVVDWPYSTFHRYISRDLYPMDWAGGVVDDDGNYGECDPGFRFRSTQTTGGLSLSEK